MFDESDLFGPVVAEAQHGAVNQPQQPQVAQPATEQEKVESAVAEQPVEKQSKEAALREYNLRALRERAEAAERRAKDLENQINQQPRQQEQRYAPVVQETDEISFGDEDLVEGKHIKKIIQAERKRYDREIQQIKSQSAIDNAERKIRAMYSDVDEVLSENNIKNFQSIYPEEFSSAMANSDPYARMKTAYTLINNLGISETRQTRDIDRRLADNRTKPRAAGSTPSTSGSTAETPLSQVSDYDRRILTPEIKEQKLAKLAQSKDWMKYNYNRQ